MRRDEAAEARRDEAVAETFGDADAQLTRQARPAFVSLMDARRRRRHRFGVRNERPARRGQDETRWRAFEQCLAERRPERAHPAAHPLRIDMQPRAGAPVRAVARHNGKAPGRVRGWTTL